MKGKSKKDARQTAAENKMDERLLYFQTAVEHASDAIGISTPGGRHYYQNPAFTKLFGLSPQEVDGKSGPPGTVYCDEQKGREVFETVMQGKSWVGEIEMLNKDKEKIDVSLRAFPIKDQEGEIIALVGMHADMTKRKKAERRLEENRKLLHSAEEISKSGGWEMDLEQGGAATWTKGVYDIVGLNPADPVPGLKEHVNWYLPEYRDMINKKIKDLIETGEPMQFEAMLKTKKGDLKWCQARGEVVEKNGKVVKLKGTFQDISERKEMERKLSASRQLIQSIIDAIPVRVFWKDRDLNFLGCNRVLARDAGFEDAKDVIGKNDFQLVWREQADMYQKDDRQVMAEGRPKLLIEEPQTTKEGKEITLLTSKVPLCDAEGKIIGVIGAYMDITDRKKMESELIKQKAFSEAIINSMVEGLHVIDNERKVVEVNPALQKMLGYSKSEIMKEDPIKFIDEKYQALAISAMNEGLSGKVGEFEAELKKRSGEKFIARIITTPLIGVDGRIEGSFATLQDITDRKRAQEELRSQKEMVETYLNTAEVMIVVINRDKKVGMVNDKACEILGYEREEIIGKNWFDHFLPERIRKNVSEVSDELFRDEVEPVEYYENPILTKSGEERIIAWHNALLKNERGEILSHLGCGEDITDRKKMENERDRLIHDMGERIKEIRCIYKITEIVWKHGETDTMLRDIVKVMPAGWSYPLLTRARIVFNGNEYCSESFQPTQWKQSSEIIMKGEPRGWVEVYYMEETPLIDEGPFLKEERNLIDTIAKTIADAMLRERAREDLEISETKYRAIFDFSRDALMTVAPPSWKFISANPAALELFACQTEEDFMKLGPWDVSPERQPDGELSSEKALQMMEKAMEEGSHYFQWDHMRLNGEVFPATVLLSKMEMKGGPMLQATVRDVTQVKKSRQALEQSEKRFMDVLHSSEDAILIIDEETFVDANETTARMLEYPTREEFLMTHPSKLSPPVQPDGQNSFDKANEMMRIATEKGFHRFEWMHRKKTGEDFPVEVSLTPISYKGKTVIHCLWRDLTEEKRLAKESQQLQQQLQQAQRLKSVGTMANGIAHNFNTILASVRGLIEMSANDVEPDSHVKANLGRAVEAIEDAKEMTKKMLTFSRAQTMALAPIKIASVIENAVDLFKASLKSPVEIKLEIEANCGPVKANESEIKQVVMNLCTNAYQAMEGNEGGIDIVLKEILMDEETAKISSKLQPGRFAHLAIQDTGKGMDQETKERIFEPFFTTKEVGEGTGLGLSVIHGIIMSFNGEILVDSQEGKGTTVNIYLPIAEGSGEDSQEGKV